MAASATNASRELGAVFGVAVLGALVDSKLTGQLAQRLKAIGIPPHFQNIVMTAITTGQVPSASSAERHSSNAAIQKIINEVINAAFSAFGSGLHLALEVSGALALFGAVIAAVTMPHRPVAEPAGPSPKASGGGTASGDIGTHGREPAGSVVGGSVVRGTDR
jgi:hypothetical protein